MSDVTERGSAETRVTEEPEERFGFLSVALIGTANVVAVVALIAALILFARGTGMLETNIEKLQDALDAARGVSASNGARDFYLLYAAMLFGFALSTGLLTGLIKVALAIEKNTRR